MTAFDQPLKRVGADETFATGAKRDAKAGKGRYDLLPWDAIMEVAKHFEKGAVLHGGRNWEKGIPLSSFAGSGMRHGGQCIHGELDEPHAVAACWNWLCFIATKLRIEKGELPRELDDMIVRPVVGNEEVPAELQAAKAAYEAKAQRVYGEFLDKNFHDEDTIDEQQHSHYEEPVQGHGNPEANENIHVEETTADQAKHEDPHDGVPADGLYRFHREKDATGVIVIRKGKYLGWFTEDGEFFEGYSHDKVLADVSAGRYVKVA